MQILNPKTHHRNQNHRKIVHALNSYTLITHIKHYDTSSKDEFFEKCKENNNNKILIVFNCSSALSTTNFSFLIVCSTQKLFEENEGKRNEHK